MYKNAAGLRDYQERAVLRVRELWEEEGKKAVCLVAPTGAGKTRICEELIDDDQTALWVAHRRDLVEQTAAILTRRFGLASVGMNMGGYPSNPKARIQVGTVQTLLHRGIPKAKHVVLDEAHHYVAECWKQIAEMHPEAKCIGPTATPQRADGTPLGDIFDALHVVASYSQLQADGFLVPVSMFRAKESLGDDLVRDVLEAWAEFSGGVQTFVFCARVSIAEEVAKKFREMGVTAASISASTSRITRVDRLSRFRQGSIRVLVSVGTLTEGIDVPEAGCGILMRRYVHPGLYLQTAGRLLRPAEGKSLARLIDLTGSTIKLGLPDTDREYSLTGRAISAPGEDVEPHAPPEQIGFTQEVVGGEVVHLGVQDDVVPIDWSNFTKPKVRKDVLVEKVIRLAGGKVVPSSIVGLEAAVGISIAHSKTSFRAHGEARSKK